MIKVIAIDFDYTLVGTKIYDEFFANTLFKSLCELCNGGIAAGIITGRPFSSLEKKFISLGLNFSPAKFPSFIICKETYVFIRKNNIFLEDHAWNKSRSLEGITVVRCFRDKIENILGMLVKRNIDPVRYFYDDEDGLEFGVVAEYNTVDLCRSAYYLICQELKDTPLKAFYNRNYLYISHQNFSKADSISRLSHKLGCKSSEVIAIGDSFNDIEALNGKYGFYSATTNNADIEVLNAVKIHNGYISSLDGSEGVLDILNSLRNNNQLYI